MSIPRLLCYCALPLLLSACGQSGALYLPGQPPPGAIPLVKHSTPPAAATSTAAPAAASSVAPAAAESTAPVH